MHTGKCLSFETKVATIFGTDFIMLLLQIGIVGDSLKLIVGRDY